ncbi:hypothetical protein PFJ87_09g00130 [Encephalitozoon hellem]|uniref:Uncharacterized protein n=1 Tax=Encephalitozoon hellem TaxID=27973 RepID=A0ABY8CM01_ENCHE|nr:hypothetical protein PFJ87_04g00100 [Encephalitozoon hellem]WEL38544.1 hypothetical protein PFJ87_05g00120 [Encephalitozoon hellem]WEL38745.1 hypothetical protein PFJ87_06g00100 [Encephalitozoon hellem]WEL39386.1 hypothetical protein PFJ87_09g00130 [Encephalitozoon hellem]
MCLIKGLEDPNPSVILYDVSSEIPEKSVNSRVSAGKPKRHTTEGVGMRPTRYLEDSSIIWNLLSRARGN